MAQVKLEKKSYFRNCDLLSETMRKEIEDAQERGEGYAHHKIMSPFPVSTFKYGKRTYVDTQLMAVYEELYEDLLRTHPEQYAYSLWNSCTYNNFIKEWEETELLYELRTRRYGVFTNKSGEPFDVDLGWESGAVLPSGPLTPCLKKSLELVNRVFGGRYNTVIMLASRSDSEMLPASLLSAAILTLGSPTMVGAARSLTLRQGDNDRRYRVPGDTQFNCTLVFCRF